MNVRRQLIVAGESALARGGKRSTPSLGMSPTIKSVVIKGLGVKGLGVKRLGFKDWVIKGLAIKDGVVKNCIIKSLVVAALAVQGMPSQTLLAAEVSGLLKSQTAVNLHGDGVQQQEWLLDLEYNDRLGQGELTAIGRLRFDTVDDLNYSASTKPDNYSAIGGPLISGQHGELGLRELYWQYDGESSFWQVGKQQVVWGEADGLKLLDRVNPQSFREFILDDFDDSRIPLWMLNVQFYVTASGTLQLLWIPDTSAHELAPTQSPFAFTSPALVPTPEPGFMTILQEAEIPDALIADSDFGLRFGDFISGWDFTLNYLFHYVDEPVVRAQMEGSEIFLSQQYERSHLLGASASTVFGNWILRTEVAYETDRYHRSHTALPGVVRANQWSSVVGLDWQGWSDQFISLQWFQTSILGDTTELVKKRREDTLTFLWESTFFNQTVTAKWLHIQSLDHEDGVARARLNYNYSSNLDLSIGADLFYGDSEQLFGQFNNTDRISIGFVWGF